MYFITAHPRSGTGFAAKTLQSCDLDVGHEKLGSDGIASWMWLPKDPKVPFGDGYIDTEFERSCFLIRNPLECIASVAFTEVASLPFRCRYADISEYSINPLEQAIDSIFSWCQMAEDQGLEFVKTERFYDYTKEKWGLNPAKLGKVNQRSHPPIEEHEVSEFQRYHRIKEFYAKAY